MGIYMFVARSALIRSLKNDSKYSFLILMGLIVYMFVAERFTSFWYEGGHPIAGLLLDESQQFRIRVIGVD